MSLFSAGGWVLTKGLSASLHPNNTTTTDTIVVNNLSNNNHNHYHQLNQYQEQQDNPLSSKQQEASSMQLLATLTQAQKIQENSVQQPSLIPSNANYDSFSLLSFLYSDNNGGSGGVGASSSTTAATLLNSGFMDYNDGGITSAATVQDAFVEGSHLWSLLVVGYAIVFIVGAIGNICLLAALCGTGSRARALPVRNNLMVNLAAADLLVTTICVPISSCAAASQACWPSFLKSTLCQIGPLLQKTPVSASTLSLALLSLDRWAAIRHPRFAQKFRERRFVVMSMAIIWILASLVAAPTFWARQWEEHSHVALWTSTSSQEKANDELTVEDYQRNTSTLDQSSWQDSHTSGVCVEKWTNFGVHLSYSMTFLSMTFVSPALIVAACHASVSHKLTAQLKVLSGATSVDRFINGSRPRPTQVLIVARDPSNNIIPNPLSPPVNNPRGLGKNKLIPCDPDDEDDCFVRMQIEADLESLRQISEYQQSLSRKSGGGGIRRSIKSISTFRSEASVSNTNNNNMLKATKRETSIIKAHRRLRNKLNVPVGAPASKMPIPLMPTYSSQSFRSRKRAANLLGALAFVFVGCWLPYVVCAILEMFLKDKSLVRLIIPFALFLGHAHSAINPVVSWRLNRSAFVRFQQQSILSFLPEWFRALSTCRLFCYSCSCPMSSFSCCDNSNGECGGHSSPPGQMGPDGANGQRPPPLRRAGTRYPGLNDNRNPFLQNSSMRRGNQRGGRRQVSGNSGDCCGGGDESDDAVPCCCCFCPSSMFNRRSSSPDLWNRNTSTNENGLGAFHPKYTFHLNRLPAQDPISKCHTSHFLR